MIEKFRIYRDYDEIQRYEDEIGTKLLTKTSITHILYNAFAGIIELMWSSKAFSLDKKSNRKYPSKDYYSSQKFCTSTIT